VIVRGGAELDILFIKRSRHDGDPWSGHVALPGGRWESPDETLLSTAIRETREETGVDLSGALHLGRLEEVRPTSPRLPRLAIHPHVFGVRPGTEARVASHEVDAVHWVSLDELQRPETAGTIDISLPGGSRTFPCLRIRGEVVWGLTYRIITDFLDRYPEEALRSGGRDRPATPPTRR
jgi:8-oxo-dGTP pyrophosphatase MutT (NUDIX family)